jgi:hypothetical protein
MGTKMQKAGGDHRRNGHGDVPSLGIKMRAVDLAAVPRARR